MPPEASGGNRRKLAEVTIQGDQRASLALAGGEYHFVGGATQPFFNNGCDVMASLAEKRHRAAAEVLVGLEPHSAGSTGSGMILSREASAP